MIRPFQPAHLNRAMIEKLPREVFIDVVRHTPLVSMDLVVHDATGKTLLGMRSNRPAKGFWFVPGGSIRKNETLEEAFQRISSAELGTAFDLGRAQFLGVYQHFYPDNFSGDDFGTHYVVLGYRLSAGSPLMNLPDDQHSGYRWFEKADLLSSDEVHENTKAYFR